MLNAEREDVELKKRVVKEGRLGWHEKRVLLQKKKKRPKKRSKHSGGEGGEATDGEGMTFTKKVYSRTSPHEHARREAFQQTTV